MARLQLTGLTKTYGDFHAVAGVDLDIRQGELVVLLGPSGCGREVVVSALGTVYSLSASGIDAAQSLAPLIAHDWGLATGLSLLAWFVFAPQCFC